MDNVNALMVGSGAREHVLTHYIAQSALCNRVIVTPGNAGISQSWDCYPSSNHQDIIDLCRQYKINFVVVGPEQPLVEGLADELRKEGILVFGPSKLAARIEGSKIFSSLLMTEMSVPQPLYLFAEFMHEAVEIIDWFTRQGKNVVVKADGLCAGKGAIVCTSPDEAKTAAYEMLVGNKFKEAGKRVLIQECLDGDEVSLLVICDGHVVIPLVQAQDYKRALDGNRGLNTGGMGSFAASATLSERVMNDVIGTIIEPVLKGLDNAGSTYIGCLYAGLMLTPYGPKVIEFNCRFGDPEIQSILPLLESDLLEMLLLTAQGKLDRYQIKWSDQKAVSVVLATQGYPDDEYKNHLGKPITGLDQVSGAMVFHAGTKAPMVNSGGRVLTVTATGETFKVAQDKVYREAEKIHFDGMWRRSDIAHEVI